MSEAAETPGSPRPPPSDQRERDRFAREIDRNFAVSANAGSGKTTAISERLAEMALSPEAATLLPRTAVVTFTKKAAAQLRQRARHVLMRKLASGRAAQAGLSALDSLDRAFFGTIHSFCLALAQAHGQALGLNFEAQVVEDEDSTVWEEFLEEDSMHFSALPEGSVSAFLRFAPLDLIFPLAQTLPPSRAQTWLQRIPPAEPPPPDPAALAALRSAKPSRKGAVAEALCENQRRAEEWVRRFHSEKTYLPMPQPKGEAGGVRQQFERLTSPLKTWLAQAATVLAAELALRYAAWRTHRGLQNYADQIEAALSLVRDAESLERLRAEKWRIILDEAQDTDPRQFGVLVEITRPAGAEPGSWPRGGGAPPEPGRFCLVGDPQQSIYGSRADVRNFLRHLEAYASEDGGELLRFQVTFRAPRAAIDLLNATLPRAFGPELGHNCDAATGHLLQVAYQPLIAGPANPEGAVTRLSLRAPEETKPKVDELLAEEARQVAAFLARVGPEGVGARSWGEVCLLAPRNDWLVGARDALAAAGLKTSLQTRRLRNGDNPVYAWMTALLAALCDPENLFEWVGVLRELFEVSDAALAEGLHGGRVRSAEEFEGCGRDFGRALAELAPFLSRIDDEGLVLEEFIEALVGGLALRERAALLDPSGAYEAELDRLLSWAAERSRDGAGPREWLRDLLNGLDEGRPAGAPDAEAINLLSCHSAKGLEWPVVILLGLWRPVLTRNESGLRLIADGTGETAYFDGACVPEDTVRAREGERLRETARLLYVAVTRARLHLLLPYGERFAESTPQSFESLWGTSDDASVRSRLLALPETGAVFAPGIGQSGGIGVESARETPFALRPTPAQVAEASRVSDDFPERVLPHALAEQSDVVRLARHETGSEARPESDEMDDPIAYGLWWHETMEFFPWSASAEARGAYRREAEETARVRGFGERAAVELERFVASGVGDWLREGGRIRTEVSLFAPLDAESWIDGVADAVAEHPAGGWRVLDWKTNRLRSGESAEGLLARLVERYRPQLEAYGVALERALGGKVELAVYSTATGRYHAWAPSAPRKDFTSES